MPWAKNECLTSPFDSIIVSRFLRATLKANRMWANKVSYSLIISFFLLHFGMDGRAAEPADSSSVVPQRLIPLSITGAVIYTGSLTGLHFLWYSDFEKQPFHFFNDNDQWLQMDKVGHAMSGYYITELSDRSLRYSGVKKNTALLTGSLVSFTYLSAIEVFDGFSAQWGFSTGDFFANTAGIALYTGQELIWNEQRLRMKFNHLPSPYPHYRPDLLGNSYAEQLLKDYNGQAYWLSTNPHNWGNAGNWPKWLNLAFGYSADGMTGGSVNEFPNLAAGAERPDFERTREFYLSLDLNLHAIEAKRNWFRAFRSLFGFIKLPAPAVGVNGQGRLIGGIR